MAKLNNAVAEYGSVSDKNNTSLPSGGPLSGFVEPYIGQVVHSDVIGYFGFPLIKKGEAVTPAIAERAQSMARLFELIAATETE